jgi:hypothetical protein
MGGYGSGWPYWKGKKTTVGECRRFDVVTLRREGVLAAGQHWRGSWGWKDARTGETTASVGLEVNARDPQAAWVRLWYEFIEGPHKGRDVDYRIPLQVTRPNYGGWRWWFTCPLQGCGQRVRILYFPRGAVYYACRHCYDLTYRSCQESDKRVSGLLRAFGGDKLALIHAANQGRVDILLALKAVPEVLTGW